VVPGMALSTGRYRPRLLAMASNWRLPCEDMSLQEGGGVGGSDRR
jgi:hypothetical protein